MKKEIEDITTKIKGLIGKEVCMGTYGLVELELREYVESQSKELQEARERIKELEEREEKMMEKAYRSGYSDCAKEQAKI